MRIQAPRTPAYHRLMRIIAGEFRSRTLLAPRGDETRPTYDRLRETLFNILQPRIEGAHFLDLYAGSGANGLEALSRGAAEAVLVEQSAPALAAIRHNMTTLGLADRVRVEGVPVARWLANNSRTAPSLSQAPSSSRQPAGFDLIFLDPPYGAADEYSATLSALGGPARDLLAPEALVIVEHRREAHGHPPVPPQRAPSPKAKPAQRSPQPGRSQPSRASAPVAPLAERYGALLRTRLLEQGEAALSFFAVAAEVSSDSDFRQV